MSKSLPAAFGEISARRSPARPKREGLGGYQIRPQIPGLNLPARACGPPPQQCSAALSGAFNSSSSFYLSLIQLRHPLYTSGYP